MKLTAIAWVPLNLAPHYRSMRTWFNGKDSMRKAKYLLLPIVFILILMPVLAQIECPSVVMNALDNLEVHCDSVVRNEACYANRSLYVEPQPDINDFKFDSEGDIEGVGKILTLSMSALNEEENAWGVVLMRLQVNLPDTLPGENVMFILFGDVELVNAVDPAIPNLKPMQAFYLRTGIGDAACSEAPESGLMIRTPENQGEITFSVNGVDVAVGSDVFLQAQPNAYLTGRVFHGSAAVNTPFGKTGGVSGTQFQVPMNGDLLPSGSPAPVSAYAAENLNLPAQLFGEIHAPLQGDEISIVEALIQAGLPLCGSYDFLPACDDVIRSLGGGKCPLSAEGVQDCTLPFGLQWSHFDLPSRADIAPALGYPGDRLPDQPTIVSIPLPTESPIAVDGVLPAGCVDGICLADPATACQCPLCGVPCPENSLNNGNNGDNGNHGEGNNGNSNGNHGEGNNGNSNGNNGNHGEGNNGNGNGNNGNHGEGNNGNSNGNGI